MIKHHNKMGGGDYHGKKESRKEKSSKEKESNQEEAIVDSLSF